MRIHVELASGGDERISPSSLSYLRPLTLSEAESNPGASCLIRLRSLVLFPVDPIPDLADEFSKTVKLVEATAPNGFVVLVHGEAVFDWDPAPSTAASGSNSWLVFGVGPRAPRLAVTETKAQLIDIWASAGLETDIFD